MEYKYTPEGVCSMQMIFEIENNIIKKLKIVGGCPGNTVGVSKLVEGRNIDEVIEMLKGTKFTYEIVSEEYNSEIEEGKIISQDPAYRNNFTIKENTKFSLVISKGTELTKMPKIVGKEYEEAVKTLEEAKLKAEKVEETSKKVQEGYVTRQDPAENTQLNAGDTVKVYVSIGTGIEQVSVPSVIGKTEENAKSELTSAKLKVQVVYEEDKTQTNGTVLKQSIDVGKVVDADTTVTITVNKISELKSGTVNIRLKNLVGYKEEKDEDGNVKTPKDVQVKVLVNDEEQYNQTHPENTEKITVTIKGKGTVDVKVKIGTTTYDQTQLNLNDSNPVWTAQ